MSRAQDRLDSLIQVHVMEGQPSTMPNVDVVLARRTLLSPVYSQEAVNSWRDPKNYATSQESLAMQAELRLQELKIADMRTATGASA
jgi:hypothetical protein